MAKKRIFVDLLNLATPQIAGVGVFTRNLFSQWLNQEDYSYEVTLYSSYGIDAEKVFGFKSSVKVQVKRVAVRHLLARLLYQQFILPFVLRRYSAYYNPAVGIPFLARIISPGTKLIVTIHDMTPFFYEKKYSSIRSVLVKLLSKSAAKAAHTIVTVSQNSKDDLVSVANVSAEKICIIYNFITHPYQLANYNDKKYFLCISTIEPGKNIENSIKGFALFKEKNLTDDYKFYWIGRIGWVYTEKQIRDLIKKYNLEDSFILLGYLTEVEKEKWIRDCTAIVYLSHYEGFGLPVLEGFSYNKPAVVSRTSSLPEVVGNAGIQCDQNNIDSIAGAMKIIITHREKYVTEIPVQLKKFNSADQVQAFDQLILDHT